MLRYVKCHRIKQQNIHEGSRVILDYHRNAIAYMVKASLELTPYVGKPWINIYHNREYEL